MPYSEELGMRVYDPREGAALGMQLGNQWQENRRQKLIEQEMRRKAAMETQRQMGLAQWQADTDSLLASNPGMDPVLARKSALIKNAALIFPDSPQSIASLVINEGEDYNRQRANELLNTWRMKRADEIATTNEEKLRLQAEKNAAIEQARAEKTTPELARAARIAELKGQVEAPPMLEGMSTIGIPAVNIKMPSINAPVSAPVFIPQFSPDQIRAQKRAQDELEALAESKGAGATYEPEVKVVTNPVSGEKQALVFNRKSGRWEPWNKPATTKQEFVLDYATKAIAGGVSAATAKKQATELYDELYGKSEPSETPEPTATETKPVKRVRWTPNGMVEVK